MILIKIFYNLKYYKYIILSKVWTKFIRTLYTFNKFFYPKHYNISQMYFLRKNKTFIKSKYSRTRQWSKVIVYFGLWYGIISVFFLIYYCYRYTFIYSYFWWIIFIFCLFSLFKNFFKNINFFFFKGII